MEKLTLEKTVEIIAIVAIARAAAAKAKARAEFNHSMFETRARINAEMAKKSRKA